VIAGPAFADAASPVIENSPAPIMAPIPRATNPGAVNVFFHPFSESAASFKSWANGFLFQIDIVSYFNVNKLQIYCFFKVERILKSLFFLIVSYMNFIFFQVKAFFI
jgi:hypothetical protein